MKHLLSCWVLLFSLLYSNLIFAQVDSTKTKVKKKHKVEFTPIPYINYSQSQKFMYGLVPMFTFKVQQKDTISPKSFAGVSYIGTTRKSWFANVFAKLYLDNDKWRIAAMAGLGNYEFQTFIDNDFLDVGFYNYGSEMSMVSLRVLRNVYKKNYLGLGYFHQKVNTKFETLPIDSVVNNNSLQVIYLNDTRKNVYYPTQGIKANIIYTMYPTWLGNNKNFGILVGNFNTYKKAKGTNVWAFRAFAKVATSKLDFQRQVVLSSVDLRGYTNGKYRGDGKVDIQAEYRYNFKNSRWGLVGFGGLATLYGSDVKNFNGKLYPSIGTGFRFLAVKDVGMRFGMDVARGKEEWAFYFRIGESF